MDPDEIANSTFEETQGTPTSGRRSMQKPDNIPDYLWEDYLYAWDAYQAAQERMQNADYMDEEQAAKDMQAARSLLSTIITQMDNYKQSAVDPEERDLNRRYKEAQIANLNRPPMGPQRAPRYPEEEQLDRLKVQEMQQKLENPYTQRMKYIQQAYEKINELQQAQIRGEIDPKEAERQIKGFYDFIQADMMGATPFQMQKDKRDFEYTQQRDKQGLAYDVLRNRSATGSSMAQGLMNTLVGAYGKMYSGANPNYDIDYFGMTKALTDEYTGGQDLNQLGLQILKGALGQGGQ